MAVGAAGNATNVLPQTYGGLPPNQKQVEDFNEALNGSTTSSQASGARSAEETHGSEHSQDTSKSLPIFLATQPPINLGNPIGKQGAPSQAGAVPANGGKATADTTHAASGTSTASSSKELNQKVLNFANSKIGKQVGTGECWDLAEEAVTKNNGKSSTALTGVEDKKAFEKANYVWGTPVSIKDSQPGDIIQFKDHKFKVDFPDGSSEWQTRGHHTAIVKSRNEDGTLTVIESHVTVRGKMNGNRAEAKDTLKLTKEHKIFLEDGTFSFNGQSVKVTTTGTATTYRPQPAESQK